MQSVVRDRRRRRTRTRIQTHTYTHTHEHTVCRDPVTQHPPTQGAVLAKLAASAVAEQEFEPIAADAEDDGGAEKKTGKKWAQQQQQEVEERNRQRAAERAAEIEAAKHGYMDNLREAVQHAKVKEQRELEDKERTRNIAVSQVRRAVCFMILIAAVFSGACGVDVSCVSDIDASFC
jgi:hypothetical protein